MKKFLQMFFGPDKYDAMYNESNRYYSLTDNQKELDNITSSWLCNLPSVNSDIFN